MSTYYIDSFAAVGGDGTSETRPLKNRDGLDIRPGDTVLLKSGSDFRQSILSPCGCRKAHWGGKEISCEIFQKE